MCHNCGELAFRDLVLPVGGTIDSVASADLASGFLRGGMACTESQIHRLFEPAGLHFENIWTLDHGVGV